MESPMPTLSVLDLSLICEGGDAAQALNNSRTLAQHCEKAGYHRYWVAEHHNMKGIASAATSVVIGHIAAGTQTIRVGSGGIMLPKPDPDFEAKPTSTDQAMLQQVGPASAVESVREQVAEFLKRTQADELILVSQIHDHQARCKSYDIAFEACAGL